jgi:hypothetical protein
MKKQGNFHQGESTCDIENSQVASLKLCCQLLASISARSKITIRPKKILLNRSLLDHEASSHFESFMKNLTKNSKMRFFKNGAYLRRVSKLLYCTKHSGFRRS